MKVKKDTPPIASWTFALDTVENYAYWQNAFTAAECKKIIKLGESTGLSTGVVIDKNYKNTVKESIRESDIVFLGVTDDTKWIFNRVSAIIMELNSKYFEFDLFGMLEGLQFTKYVAPTGHYGKHIDKGYNGLIRKLSITIQLSSPDEYEGGNLILTLGENPSVTPKQLGCLTAFPSYVLHEVTPITKGTRYSLVAWVTGPKFK